MTVTKIGLDKWQARVGDFFGPVRNDKQAALKALSEQLETYKPLNHDYVRCGDGTVLHLFQTPSHGWNFRIIPTQGYVGQGVGVMGTLAETRTKARTYAEQHHGGVENVSWQ